jgi:diacylglycerol kinase family enzyme
VSEAPSAAGPLFIVMNARSGRQGEQERRETIARTLQQAGREHRLFLCDRRNKITTVAAQAVAAARAAQGVVVAAGGDGTINAVANAVLGSGCAFGVLPQGTFNYFGRNHRIPEETEPALELLLTGVPQPVQVGRVNDRIFLVNASLGLYPQLLEDREAFKNRFGRSRVIAGFAAAFSLLREHRQLLLDVGWHSEQRERAGADHASGQRILRTPTLFVGNNRLQLEQIGIEQAPAVEQGQLVAIAPRAISTASMFGLALQGALGRLGEAETVRSLAFTTLHVEPARRRFGAKRFKLATDGEILWMKPPMVFTVDPQPLWLIRRLPDEVQAAE